MQQEKKRTQNQIQPRTRSSYYVLHKSEIRKIVYSFALVSCTAPNLIMEPKTTTFQGNEEATALPYYLQLYMKLFESLNSVVRVLLHLSEKPW